ncbi:MAG: AMP-binding protein, partial [Alphaproteobacteria bacterium]|nr:AMP-binding protein [Alphaproteobacteria bacterium]
MGLPVADDHLLPFEERFWVKSYRPGVPATIDDELRKWSSVVALFAADVNKHRGRTGFVSMGTGVTYGELYDRATRFAAWLQSRGVKHGDRVAIMMPNCLQYPVALFGTLMAGAVVVNVNPLYTPRELEHQLKDSGAVAIVVLEMFAHTLQEALAGTEVRHIVVTALGDMLGTLKGFAVTMAMRHLQKLVPRYRLPRHTRWQALMKQAQPLTLTPAALEPDDLAFLQYTGGTTGVAKGAMLTHRNIVANILQGR